MKHLKIKVITLVIALAMQTVAWASGSPYQLAGYATAGANPTVVFVVTDQYGNGVQGTPINITSSAGILDSTSGTTLADGTFTVHQTGGNIGDQITATCAQVLTGSPLTITSAAALVRVNTDTVYSWFDESRHMVNAVVVTSGKGVLTSTSNFNFSRSDQTSSNYRDLTVHYWNNIQQTVTTPAQMEVFQGSYSSGDYINIDETGVSGNPDGTITFSANQPGTFLNAYAVDGASPTVCAVVTNYDGMGLAGVTVTANASAGTMLPATVLTDESGMAYFYQQGGSLGDTITITCPTQTETSPMIITTAVSQARQTTDRLFSWYGTKDRKVYCATVTRSNNVLVTGTSSFPASAVNAGGSDNISPAFSAFKPQTSIKPAEGFMAYGTTQKDDVLRFYNNDSNAIYRSGNYLATLVFPDQEEKYLLAFATGGENPTVWAVVTDESGNALKGEPVSFAMQGPGALAWTSAMTSWNGVTKTTVSGASALGNTIAVSSPGLGTRTIFTSVSAAMTSSDQALGWYDPEVHKVFCVFVDSVSHVMTVAGNYIDDYSGGNLVDKSPGNNDISISSFSDQTDEMPTAAYLGLGTVSAGDIVRLDENNTSANYDLIIVVDPDPDYFLFAFASGGVDPKVYAVVTDKDGKGIKDVSITFTAAQGSMSTVSTVTGYGGMVTSDHTSGALGNTITVSSPGLPPVAVITSDYANGTGLEQAIAWYDASRQTIWGLIVTDDTKVAVRESDNNYSSPITFDNSSNGRAFDVNSPYPAGHNMSRTINPLAQWVICPGTAGIGDQVIVNMGYSTPGTDAFITINEIKSSFLQAFATSAVNPVVTALVVTDDGVGMEGIPISFSSNNAFSTMSGGPSWITSFDGTVSSTESGGASQDVITVSAAGYPDVQILTNAGVGGVLQNSKVLSWYAAANHKINTAVIRYPCYNLLVSTIPTVNYLAIDETAGNNRILAVSGAKTDVADLPTYAYIAPGTNGGGDKINIQVLGNVATDDAMVTLPVDPTVNLRAFATGGINPTVFAMITDENGNGVPGVNVHFQAPVSTAMSLTDTATDDEGLAVSTQSNGSLGNVIYVSAEGVANTITVKATPAQNITTSTRMVCSYGIASRTARAAFVNVPENVMALNSNATFSAFDFSTNGRTITLQTPTVQQTGSYPAYVTVTTGSEGEGDQIRLAESNTSADPEGIITISVPFSEISSTLAASPDPVLTNQEMTVTMTVYNVGGPDALSVSPTALAVAGNAAYLSGPTPASYASIPGGSQEAFTWTYLAAAPGGVTFTGQAMAIDSFSTNNLTTTATDSNPILIRDPEPPVLTTTLGAQPATVSTGQMIDVTMTVTNDSSSDVPQGLTVTPSTLGIIGGATYYAGPTPTAQFLERGDTKSFFWSYTAGSPGYVTITGQAYTTDPFDAAGVTSNAAATVVTVQSPANLACVIHGPQNAERLRDFTLTMTVTNTGQATALLGKPLSLAWTGSDSATVEAVGSTSPGSATILGGASQDFTWLVTVGSEVGTLTFTGNAQALDLNSGNTVTSSSVDSNVINVIQGAINLDRVLSSANQVYQGQKAIPVTMEARNTSLMSVTITAANLTFNHSQTGFTVIPAPDNPTVVGPQSSFTLDFYVDIGTQAPVGAVTVDGTISGDAETGAMAANGAQSGTAQWTILKPFNSMHQNYPNPLKLSQRGYTTFDYYVAKDEAVSINLYNLAGELVAVVVDGRPGVGAHQAMWYGDNGTPDQRGSAVGSGVYLAVYKIGSYQEIKKVVVIR